MNGAANPHKISERITIEAPGTRARAIFKGETLAESDNALVLLENGYTPRIYFPQADVRMDLLNRTDTKTHCPFKGDAAYWTLSAGGKTLENAAWAYLDPLPEITIIAGHISFVDAVQVES
jgi:uncharacterized protein (DUF427 family)